MKSFGKYISKHLITFLFFIILVVFINILAFGITFHQIIYNTYGEISPRNMLEQAVNASTEDGITDEAKEILSNNDIWAMLLKSDGNILWNVDLPKELSHTYTVQDVALFSKGYLADYPVFIYSFNAGLLVLGYPKDSYTKITSNYYPTDIVKAVPMFVIIMLFFDLVALFLLYYHSKRAILKNTEPIADSIEKLSHGQPILLSINGELKDVADSLNKASQIIGNQNTARANWISGVSHDIRTPLSMIMGYADRIANDDTASEAIKTQAAIVRAESIKIKDLVADLNLVSQLEYEMQPLKIEKTKVSKLLRTFIVDTLNAGIPEHYSIELIIEPDAEQVSFECDHRLMNRALSNLIQNSITHNPNGCAITVLLRLQKDTAFQIAVMDDGVGVSTEKLLEIQKKPHYLESTDERLALRHGLGLVLVQHMVHAHGGTMKVSNREGGGFQTILIF